MDIPIIRKELSDQKTILLTLAVGAKGQLSPEMQQLLKELLDRSIRASLTTAMDNLKAEIAKVQHGQTALSENLGRLRTQGNNVPEIVASFSPKTELASLKDDVDKLSKLVERQQKFAVASPIVSWLTPAYLAKVKEGQVVTFPAGIKGEADVRLVVKNAKPLTDFANEVSGTYKALGLEPLPVKSRPPSK